MTAKDLARLSQVTDAARQAAELRFAGITRQEQDIADQLAALDSARKGRAAEAGGTPDIAFSAGADLRWHRWIDGRKEELNRQLARLRAERMRARDELRQAFGRARVVATLAEKAQAKERAERERRSAELQ